MIDDAHTAKDLPRLPFPPSIIGIAGASGSGKTTLAVELARELDGFHFPLDNYYLDLSHLPLPQRPKENFDDPALIESALLAKHISALSRGETSSGHSTTFQAIYEFLIALKPCGRLRLCWSRDYLPSITTSYGLSISYGFMSIHRMRSVSSGACGEIRSSADALQNR